MSGEVSDPFATAELRARVLAGWAASPSRFREDANAEEDYALGGYRDRVVVELAQNAADAAARAGVPGRLKLTLRDGTLTAANTGAPLDAAGVEALSTLRASSKRAGPAGGETVGRFGVGFAAVVAVSDCPRIRSSSGPVCWSRERTRELVAAIPALSGELAARSGHVPVLRLPFADTGDEDAAGRPGDAVPGEGFVTAVELPLRDAGAVGLVSRLLEQAGAALLLALPALAEVIIETGGKTRVLTAVPPGRPVHRSRGRSAERVAGRRGGRQLDSRAASGPARRRTGQDLVVGPLGGAGDRRRRPGRAAACRDCRGDARAHADRRAAGPACPAAGLVPAEPRPAAGRARDARPTSSSSGRPRSTPAC